MKEGKLRHGRTGSKTLRTGLVDTVMVHSREVQEKGQCKIKDFKNRTSGHSYGSQQGSTGETSMQNKQMVQHQDRVKVEQDSAS